MSTPERIQAKPLRHPWRWTFAVIILLLAAWFIFGAARNEAYGWDTYFAYLLDTRIAFASLHSLAITLLSLIIGVDVIVILAVLRMSPFLVLLSVSWIFLWVFRCMPIYVQLVFWVLLGVLYQSLILVFAEISLEGVFSS